MTRQVDKVEFYPSDTSSVDEALDAMVAAGDGWINLLPGVTEAARERETVPSGPFAMFGTRAPATTMCTLMPPKKKHRGALGVTVGIIHPRGSKAVLQLREVEEPVPTGWRVRSDHARRGLVVVAPVGTTSDAIVDWAVRAGTALCAEEMTGSWQAVIYRPNVA